MYELKHVLVAYNRKRGIFENFAMQPIFEYVDSNNMQNN